MGPCHHSMARPRVADRGTASSYGGYLRIHCIISRGQMTRGGPPDWGLGVGLTTPHNKNKPVTKHKHESRTWTDSIKCWETMKWLHNWWPLELSNSSQFHRVSKFNNII
jgi:hypothetical protein